MISDLLQLWPAAALIAAGWFARDMLCRYRENQQTRRYLRHEHPHVKSSPPRKPR